jgi:triosephosphate isomerase (TIM)
MKRTKVIAGNWKMYKSRDEAIQFMYEVSDKLPERTEVETVICAPAIMLRDLVKREGEQLRIGAQNMHEKDEGAFTGEISAKMLTSYGVEYVVLGHSERRAYYHESDALINLKTKQAISNQLVPIVCVGESLETREAGTTDAFVEAQIKAAYHEISASDASKTIIAYEPIWAIGTGKTATSEQANETILSIRHTLESMYDTTTAQAIRILYGGSVKPTNIEELLSMSDIDGALIGGASLDAQGFIQMANAAKNQ